MKNIFRCLAMAAVCSAIFIASVSAEDIAVTSTFDKRTVSLGEEVHLTIRISGAQGNVQAPRLPAFDGFDTFYTGRASRLTFINNQSSSSVEFSYVLVPKQAGTHTLAAIEVALGGRNFRTDPVQIEVVGSQGGGRSATQPMAQPPPYARPQQSASAPSGPVVDEPPPTFDPADDNIFVRAWTDKTSVYPNEQILLTYALYTRYDTRYEGFEDEPEVSGFWIEDFPMEKEVHRETVRVNGKRYVKADIKKMALFPTAAAEYTIQPGSIKASIRQEPQATSVFDEFFNDSFFSGGSFFARRENRLLKPPPIQITVKPFPEQGKPPSFESAVGNFRISATADKSVVKQNEPVTVKIVIEGEGNIETLNKPKIPEMKAFKVYDSDTSSQLYKTGDVIGGRKTFEIVFIPTEAGQKKIPKLDFSFFNPSSHSYVTLNTPEFPLTVEPSEQTFKLPTAISQDEAFKKKVQVESQDIRYIHETLPSSLKERALHSALAAFFGMDVFMALLLIAGLWRAREERIFAGNNALKRRRFARSNAEARIRKLKSKSKFRSDEEAAAYFQEVEKILTQYLSDKFNVSAYGVTRQELEQKLEQTLGPEDPLYKEILELYAMCHEFRYAKSALREDMQHRSVKILQNAIQRVERLKV